MKENERTYPHDLAGLYRVNFSDYTLTPIQLPNAMPSDYVLININCDNDIGVATFRDGVLTLLPMEYDEHDNSYTFPYRGVLHSFQVRANLEGLKNVLEIKILIDFTAF